MIKWHLPFSFNFADRYIEQEIIELAQCWRLCPVTPKVEYCDRVSSLTG